MRVEIVGVRSPQTAAIAIADWVAIAAGVPYTVFVEPGFTVVVAETAGTGVGELLSAGADNELLSVVPWCFS